MTDIFIDFIPTDEAFNFGLKTAMGDLKTEDGLKAAVIYSLFTDRIATDDDIIPDGTDNKRGHWADAYLENAQDSEGSKLWLLAREKQTTDTLNRAVEYTKESLQWLINDSVASDVGVIGEWIRTGVLALRITMDIIDGQNFTDTFEVTV